MNFFKSLKYRHVKATRERSRFMTVALIFLILGILSITGAIVSYLTIEKNYKSEVPKGNETYPFTAYLSVHVLNIPLEILPSPDEDIHIDYVSDSDIDIHEEDGRLYIEQDAGFVISVLNSEILSYGIRLYLPEREYMNISLETNSGVIKSCPLSSYIIKLRSKSAPVYMESLRCNGSFSANIENAPSEISLFLEGEGEFTNGKGVCALTLQNEMNIAVRPDSFVYINGLASEGVENENVKNRISLSTLGGKFRITTSKSERK